MTQNKYGSQKSLVEILEELSLYCLQETGKKCDIKLVLPDEVLNRFILQFTAKEKYTFPEESDPNKMEAPSVHGTGGTVSLVKQSDDK
jgi:hypothetical protein